MCDYLSISDSKVDSYLPQFDAQEKRPLVDRIHRLDAVEEKLRAEKTIGSAAGAESWIDGTVNVAAVTSYMSYLHSLLTTMAAIATTRAGFIQNSDESLSRFMRAGVKEVGGRSAWSSILMEIASHLDQLQRQPIGFLARRLMPSDEIGPAKRRYTLASPL